MNRKNQLPPNKNNFIDPTAQLVGTVVLGQQDYIGPFVRVNAQGTFQIQLSSQDNLQDHAFISATERDVTIGDRTSIAHGAQVLNSSIGNFVFVGFNARVANTIIEDGAMILHGANVSEVTIPKDRVVPPGAVVTKPAQIDQLPTVMEANRIFKEEVISVNIELSAGYSQIVSELGPAGVQGASPSPQTSWSSKPVLPVFGSSVTLAGQVRVIGNARVGDGSSVGSQVSIRADEGSPILIGPESRIGDGVTFHALEGQSIEIGKAFTVGDRAVLHGALYIGDQVSVGSQAVVFKANIGSQASIGNRALVIGVSLADGARIPDGALVLDQAAADQFASPGAGKKP